MAVIQEEHKKKLIRFTEALIDQESAEVLVEPKQNKPGFWFGGGKLVESTDGTLFLSGRYRNQGDSRTGLGAGERGLELVVMRSNDRGGSFEKVFSLQKADLTSEVNGAEARVISIEGTSLHFTEDGVELYVSSEKNISYPEHIREFQKPGSGVWTIDVLTASTVEELSSAKPRPLLYSSDPRFLHVKDPVVFDMPAGDARAGDTGMVFCTHPYNWSSSNSAYTIRRRGESHFDPPDYHMFPRGFTWDVAMSRITAVLQVPKIGAFAETDPISLIFYDGGECVRNLDEHKQAVKRPRGYSCEELGGLAFSRSHGQGINRGISRPQRLSVLLPQFVSPYGTGSSRYVDVMAMEEGFYAIWQQSQEDKSQPLVKHFVPMEEARGLLD
jgi:hypothetical protein